MVESLLYFLKRPMQFPIVAVTKCIPYFKFLYRTRDYQGYVNFEYWFKQKVLKLGGNSKAYWPVHSTSTVYDVENIIVGIDAYPGIMPGCYITGRGGLIIGDYTQIAPNVVIVTSNHDVFDTRKHITAPIKIGKYCWIGAGATILPGVELGDFTIVAAGAVVTKSFATGFCIVGGVPAKIIKHLDPEKCVYYEPEHKYIGYIPLKKFEDYRKKHLNV